MPTALTAVPARVQDRLRFALGALRAWQAMVENARAMERLAQAPGRYEYDLRHGQADAALRAQVEQAEGPAGGVCRAGAGQRRRPRGRARGAGRTARAR